MIAQSFAGTLNANDLSPGAKLIDGGTLAAMVKQVASGQGGLTALAGGGIVGATLIQAYISEFTVVASGNDSALLPPALSGLEYEIVNSGASTLRVYCSNGNPNNLSAGVAQADNIVNLAGGNATFIAIPANAVGVFSCATLGRWKSQNQ